MFLQLSTYQTIKRLLIALLLLIGMEAIALDTNNNRLHINSDSLTIDRIKATVEYLGNVVVFFDDIVLTTEKLYVIYKTVGNEKTIDHIVIPTKLTIKREMKNELLIADFGEYYPDLKQIILTGNVIVNQDDNIAKTHKLIYYIDLKNG